MKAQKSRSPLAVVTGAASGIGLATTQKFVYEGYRVAALDRSAEGLERLKRSKIGWQVFLYECDLNQIATLTPLAHRIVKELGPPRALVNNAGAWFYEAIDESTDEHWQTTLNVNLVAAAALARGFVPSMKKVKGAAIVSVASRNALSSSPKASSYDASKAGLLGLTRTLAIELEHTGVTVCAYDPGPVDTALLRRMQRASADDFRDVEGDRAQEKSGHVRSPKDAARVIAYLVLATTHRNGQMLPMDDADLARAVEDALPG